MLSNTLADWKICCLANRLFLRDMKIKVKGPTAMTYQRCPKAFILLISSPGKVLYYGAVIIPRILENHNYGGRGASSGSKVLATQA